MTWLTGWTRRKSKVVNGLTTPDYQMKLTIHQSGLGPDTSTDIYLGGYIRSDFADLRFTGPDQITLLSYWIESISGTSPNQVATVWIKGPTLVPINNIYIYYDNPAATSLSSGTNTFLFFDDFNDGNYNGWTVINGTWSAASGYLTKTDAGGWHGIFTPFALDSGVWEWDMKHGGDSNLFKFFDTTATNVNSNGYSVYFTSATSVILYETPSGTAHITFARPADSNFHKIKVTRSPTGLMEVFFDDVSKGIATDTTHSGSQYLSAWCYDAGGAFDRIRVRKYASPEPTFGASGTDELNVTATAMTLDKTSCAGPCTINAYVTWHNYGNTDITSFTTAVLVDGTTLAYGAPISIPAGGETSSGAITTPTLSIGSHTICPYPN